MSVDYWFIAAIVVVSIVLVILSLVIMVVSHVDVGLPIGGL